ncbi:PadR family transcriptional regulator [Ornithinimicrobium cerasi]|uniref:Transcriptional regulator, PadR family n=1 Tax=Ornithinimicrobium cerasi TaxID=2248773 RepID=A0A285VEJ1_9MICO|nr:PadR family transcriptional regulator [Ornithinimicrobium cerasi]SOC52403.1 transcriptional regulator, PadR family [Ornithinimicrobium cerasi]
MTRPAKTRYAVLGMLTHGPMTGYRLREQIRETVGHFWQESFGQLYPTLSQLEQEGLVRRGGDADRRDPWEITAAGRQALRAWLATEAESLSPERNELLLQIFFGRHADPGVLRGHLARHRERLEEARAHYAGLEALVAAEDSPDRTYWLITVRHGLALVGAGLRWNADAAALLDEEGPV